VKKKSRIIEEMYEAMRDLHAAGVVGDQEMDEVASIHDSYQAPQYSADMVKDLRRKLNLTQVSLASVLNTSASSVQQWERGVKKPGGPSCKLLHLLARKGLSALL